MLDLRKTPEVFEVRPTAPPGVPLIPSGPSAVADVSVQGISVVIVGSAHPGLSPPTPLPQ